MIQELHLLFYKQKTSYEMRISNWSSYVCSSYLIGGRGCPDSRGNHPGLDAKRHSLRFCAQVRRRIARRQSRPADRRAARGWRSARVDRGPASPRLRVLCRDRLGGGLRPPSVRKTVLLGKSVSFRVYLGCLLFI